MYSADKLSLRYKIQWLRIARASASQLRLSHVEVLMTNALSSAAPDLPTLFKISFAPVDNSVTSVIVMRRIMRLRTGIQKKFAKKFLEKFPGMEVPKLFHHVPGLGTRLACAVVSLEDPSQEPLVIL